MSKNLKIIELLSGKTEQLSFALNPNLKELFKKACKNNNSKPTKVMEKLLIEYIDKNNLF